MGVVYEAEHTLIGRQVAVKLLHPDLARRPEVVERFGREARAATAIRHANIIEVTDMGRTPAGQPFLVMELLEGTPLARLLEGGRRIPAGRLLGIMDQVLDALDAAHGKGIVHRDLKPDNVFLIRHAGRDDFVKLLDFGISKMTGAAGGGVSITRTGSMLGTPQYMAPEQAMGLKDLDHRVDLWAVGVMLYEACTGRPPFPGENYNEVLYAILSRTLPPPRTIKPDVDPALERVILRAMAKERNDRYATAAELRAALAVAGGWLPAPGGLSALGSRLSDPQVRPPEPEAEGPEARATSREPEARSPEPAPDPKGLDGSAVEQGLGGFAAEQAESRPPTLTPGAHDTVASLVSSRSRSRMPRYLALAGIAAVVAVAVVIVMRGAGGGAGDSAAGVPGRSVPAPHAGPSAPVAPQLHGPAAGPPELPAPPPAVPPGTGPATAAPVPVEAGVPPPPAPPPAAESPATTASPTSTAAGRDAGRAIVRPGRDAGAARPPADAAGRPSSAASADAGAPAVPTGPGGDAATGQHPAREAGLRDSGLFTQYEEPFDRAQGTPAAGGGADAGRGALHTGYE
jgi:serine/threonine-protein kinase